VDRHNTSNAAKVVTSGICVTEGYLSFLDVNDVQPKTHLIVPSNIMGRCNNLIYYFTSLVFCLLHFLFPYHYYLRKTVYILSTTPTRHQ